MSLFNPANAQAQCDCADFAGNLETPLPDIFPFCGGFNLNVSVTNIDENKCSGAPMIRVWIGTDNKGPNYPAVQSINYLGDLPLVYSDFIGVSPPQASLLDLQYRRFYFNLDTLQYLDSIDHTLRFSFDPEIYALADFYTIVVEVLNQDTISCGTYAYSSNTFINDVDVHELLTQPPVGGLVSDLLADTILFNNNIVEALTIRGGLDVDVSYTFDGPGGPWGRPQLFLSPGDQIIVRTGSTLTLINTDIFTCDTLAYGIVVEPGAKLYAKGCNLNDNRFAIDAKPGAVLELINNTFSDNYVGLNLDMSSGSAGSRRVMFGSMVNNTIKSDQGLKAPYVGMPEAVENRGYCGILLKNYEHFNVGGNQTFSQLANGIVGLNSTGNITYMTFDDMNSVDQSAVYPHEGFGVHLQGKNGSYWFNINQTYTTMSFNNCKTGVYAKSYAGRVAGTTMTNVGTGIEWLQSNNRDMKFRENEITARQFGIKTFFNEPVHSHSIMENNNITVTEGLDDGNNSVGAIEMSELSMGSGPTGPIPVTPTSDGWEVVGSTITMKKGGNGILYRNGVNGILNANSINNQSEPSDYKGINTLGSFFIGVSNNTIFQETSAGLGSAYGIYSAGGQANTFQCNCIDKTDVGMQFFDMADFPNAVRGNNFNKHCTGLQLGFDGIGGTIIGDQEHAGNLWDLSAIVGGCLGGRNYGSPLDIARSEFKVFGASNSALNPSVFPNSGWFENITGTTFIGCSSCSFPTTIPPRLTETNTPTAFDFEVANGNYTTDDYSNEMLWKARYRLYRKLLRRPAVENYNPVFTTFKSGYQNTSFAKLAFIAEQKAQLFNLTEAQDSMVENLRLTYRTYDNNLRLLDSLVQSGANVSETSYNTTKGFAANALGSYKTYDETIRAERMEKIRTLDSLNALVFPIMAPDANHKAVNAVVFDFLLTDSIAVPDLTTLEAIAAQCPLEGGDAVYEARAIVGYFIGAQYGDEEACKVQPREQFVETIPASEELLVFPNPTTGELRWEGVGYKVATVQVFNLLGQLQMQQNTTAARADLSRLPEGLYTVQFLNVDNILLASKKIQLIRR